MSTPTAIKLTKQESAIMRWVQRAKSKDRTRPILTGVNVNGSVVACDGFRLHAVKTSEFTLLPALSGNILDLSNVKAGEGMVELSVIPGSYPEYNQILPAGIPAFEIAVNPKLLIDALTGLGNIAVLKFYGSDKPMEVYGKIEANHGDDTRTYSLIMPMFLNGEWSNTWRPDHKE